MKKLLGIFVVVLLWCNFGVASELGGIREIGTDQKCLELFEEKNIFEGKMLPLFDKNKGTFVTYIGCNKNYNDWGWWDSTNFDLDKAHTKAYHGCVSDQMPKYNLTGCHLFSINDVIVWGKDLAFVAKLEKEVSNFDNNKYLKIFESKKYLFRNPYNGSIVFKKDDPSTLKKITFKKKRNIRTEIGVGKWRDGRWYLRYVPKNHKSFSFVAEYEDNIKLEIFIEYNQELMKEKKFADNEMIKAEKKAKYFAKMFGQMPHFLKKYTNKIFIHRYNGKGKDLKGAWAPWKKKEFHLTETRCGDNYYLELSSYQMIQSGSKKYNECAGTVLHEIAHLVHRNTNVISPSKWMKMKKADKHFCTKYAMTNGQEDFAESVMCWVGVRYKSDRMSKKDVMVINKFMKNRIKFFDELNLNAHPLKTSINQ